MAIAVYSPQISVILTRLVNRTQSGSGFAPSFQTIDITPYLGTAGTINTVKDIGEACGAFSITFADRHNPDFADSIYGLVEPMDLVEIRGTRHPQGTDAKLPLIMRGFVATVSREESMGQDGSPQRVVRIVGQDMGKLLEIFRVLFEFMAATQNTSYIEQFKLQVMLGIDVQVMPVADFMKQLIDKVVNRNIQYMSIFANENIQSFQTDTVTVPDGLVSPQLAAQIDSVSMWQLMETFADRPWNELFVQDQEDGPHLVFRPVPYKDYTEDNFIMNGATDPGTINIAIEDVVSMTLARSDHRVANFFWVPPGVSQLDSSMLVDMAALAQGYPLDLEHDANNPNLFGQRKMQATTNLYPQDATAPSNMLPPSDKQQGADEWVTWIQSRARQLMALNRDNSQFEEGQLTVRGSDRLTIGTYAELTRGDLVSQMYIESVSHQIAPLQGWVTQLRVIRGTGYRERSQFTISPYLAEGFQGPYS